MSFCLSDLSNLHSISTCNISGCFVVKVVATLKMNDVSYLFTFSETNMKMENCHIIPKLLSFLAFQLLKTGKGNGNFRKKWFVLLIEFSRSNHDGKIVMRIQFTIQLIFNCILKQIELLRFSLQPFFQFSQEALKGFHPFSRNVWFSCRKDSEIATHRIGKSKRTKAITR